MTIWPSELKSFCNWLALSGASEGSPAGAFIPHVYYTSLLRVAIAKNILVPRELDYLQRIHEGQTAPLGQLPSKGALRQALGYMDLLRIL